MKFEKYIPTEQLRPYLKYFVVSESEFESQYKVFPTGGLVIGFQYKGGLSILNNTHEIKLALAGITGISDRYKIFKNSADIGTILVYFTEIGFSHFVSFPVHELFNLSLSLDEVFDSNKVTEVQEKLLIAITDQQRIQIVEDFFVSQLKDMRSDTLILEAIKLIYQSNGTIRIRALNERLCISQSPFEKRFRKAVGTTAKKFASIIRFNNIIENLNYSKSLTELSYENNFFDQAHFIKDFKQFTGDTPENFRRFL